MTKSAVPRRTLLGILLGILFWVMTLGLARVAASNTAAEQRVFRCESQGKVTYSDIPCAIGAEEVEVGKGLNSFTANDVALQTRSTTEPKQPKSKHASSKQANSRQANSNRAGPRAGRSGSIAEEQARHRQQCKDFQERIDAISKKLWSDNSLRKRSSRSEQLRDRQSKLEEQRRIAKCH